MVAVEDLSSMEETADSLDRERWQKEMKTWLKTIEDKSIWTKASLPPGKVTIPCNFVLKRKLDD